MQAKDITDEVMLAVLDEKWQSTGEVWKHFPFYPEKVVHAKLKQLLKRKLIDGCPCGCRGDWHIPEVKPLGGGVRMEKSAPE